MVALNSRSRALTVRRVAFGEVNVDGRLGRVVIKTSGMTIRRRVYVKS